jgi:hypothetical protein
MSYNLDFVAVSLLVVEFVQRWKEDAEGIL